MLKRKNNISKPENPKYYYMYHLHNLLQYFYVIGLDNKTTSKMSFYKNSNLTLKPKITTKYPNINLPYLNIPNEIIISHCFPNGFKLLEKNNNNIPQSEYFFFSIDNPNPLEENNNFRHEKIHFSCLLFYEDIKTYYKIFSMKNCDFVNDFLVFSKYVPKIICFCSFYPFYIEYIKILQTLRSYINENFDNGIDYPIESYIDSLIFKIPTPPKGIFKINLQFLYLNINFEQKCPNEIPLPEVDLLYLFHFFTIDKIFLILKYILFEYPIFIFHNNKYELSSIIEGLICLIFPFKYQYSIIPILPIENFSLIRYMKCFIIGINGKYYEKYFDDNKIEISDKTVIVINIFKDKKLLYEIFKIEPNIKKPEIFLEQISSFEKNYKNENSIEINLPEHYTEKTMRRIRDFFLLIKFNNITKIQFNEEIRKITFYYFVSLFVEYQKFIIESENITQNLFEKFLKGKIELNDIFNSKKFLEKISKNDIPFFTTLINTEMFKKFIIKKVFPITTQDKLDVLLFDENIIKKVNKNLFSKSISTPFLDYKFDKNVIMINIENRNFNRDEKIFLSTEQGKKKALDYNQLIIDNSYNSNSSINSKMNKFLGQFINIPSFKIKYYGFPNLLYDKIFFKKIEDNNNIDLSNKEIESNDIYKMNPGKLFMTYENICEKIIENEIIKKNYEIYNYSLNNISLRPNMSNYILLLWLKYFALSFWYLIPIERKTRWNEIKKVLLSCSFIDENLYTLILRVILNYGDINMVIEYFEFMKKKSYLIYLLLKIKFSIEKKKKKSNNINNDNLNNNNEQENEKKLKRSLTKSTLKDDKDKIIFETKVKCQNCNNEIDLLNITTDFSKMDFNTKNLKINCTCNNTFLASMNVKVQSNKGENVYYEKFNLYTPYFLYNLNWEKTNNKINISSFSIDYPERFWNAIWYFSLQNLSCDFLIPYKKNNEFEIQKVEVLNFNKNDFIYNNIKSKTDIDLKIEHSDVNIKKKHFLSIDIPISKIKSNFEMNKSNRKEKSERNRMKKKSEYKTIKRRHLKSFDIKDSNVNDFNIREKLDYLKLEGVIDIKDIKDINLNNLYNEKFNEK